MIKNIEITGKNLLIIYAGIDEKNITIIKNGKEKHLNYLDMILLQKDVKVVTLNTETKEILLNAEKFIISATFNRESQFKYFDRNY